MVFEFDPHTDPGAAQKRAGRYEVQVIRMLERTLQEGDTFIDVGANIGYVSFIGAGLVGTTGQVHSFEPVPRYCKSLRLLSDLNPTHHIYVHQCAVGDAPGTAPISVAGSTNIGWNTMVPGFMKAESVCETVDVPVITLSDHIAEKGLTRIRLIKIDVEGFEYPVLAGLGPFFAQSRERPSIICEVAPHSYQFIGRSLADLDQLMAGFGYQATRLYGDRSPLSLPTLAATTDVLFTPR